MMNWLKAFRIIIQREIYPARDGSRWKYFFYQLFVFDLPIMGIALLLVLVSYSGLCLIGAEQGLERRMEEFKASPFTALFAKGYFYLPSKGEKEQDNYFNLRRWINVNIAETFSSSQVPEILGKHRLFGSVKPFSWIYLDIRMKNGEHLPFQQGMGLPIQGEHADQPLIQEIENRLYKDYQNEKGLGGIIVSVEGMKRFGWHRMDNYPDLLWIRLSGNDPQKQEKYIPIHLSVVDKLPYQFHYILPIDQLYRLKNRYYYDPTKQFDITFLNKESFPEPEQIKKVLPTETQISTLLKGGKETFRILLPKPLPRIDILKNFADKNILGKHTVLFMGTFDTGYYVKSYKGAIFHLNFQLPGGFTWNKEHIYTIQNFMDRNGVKVEGEVVELLSEILNTQENLRNLQGLFKKGLLVILMILLFFFAVVLHTRMHRIGIKRMLGYPDWVITGSYVFVGVFLVIITFGIAIFILHYMYSPIKADISLNLSLITLFFEVLTITEIGFLVPVLYYLHSLQPAEMMTFRS